MDGEKKMLKHYTNGSLFRVLLCFATYSLGLQ